MVFGGEYPLTDCNVNLELDACDLAGDASIDGDPNCIPDECQQTIIASDPPDGAIDARQPNLRGGSTPTGWTILYVTMSAEGLVVTPQQFLLTEEGGDGVAHQAYATHVIDTDTYLVLLMGSIEPGARTTITYLPSGSTIALGYLPGDVDGDGSSGPRDILALIDTLNGLAGRPVYSTDIDRSGVTDAADVLRLVDLITGAVDYDAWNGRSLP